MSEGNGNDSLNLHLREFFVKTIRLGRTLRPKARWGFFDYPLCNYDAGETGEPECKTKYDTYNEE